MYGRIWTLIIAIFVVFAAPLGAKAEPASCADRAKVLQHLSGAYKESPVAMGLANNGGVIEVMRSPDNATFTIVITMPDGQSCMIAAGNSWETLPRRLAGGPGI